jgi:predicted peptidase
MNIVCFKANHYICFKQKNIMTKKCLSLIAILSLLTIISCEKPASDVLDLNPEEIFEETDAPVEYVHDNLSFHSPWGYNKPDNATRLYPILVSGMWGEGESYYQSIAQDYPAFVIDYQKNSESDGRALAQWIRSAIDSGYRIDSNRIYLTGFSYGGSSSYPLAKGMYAENAYFAAIIRVAGQSQSDLGNEIAKKTAVWYHIGLTDTQTRVEVARSSLEYMRNYECNLDAIETEKTDNITGYERTTVSLTRLGFPMFIYSEYTDMGHTPGPCYKDEALFPWLFNHSLIFH